MKKPIEFKLGFKKPLWRWWLFTFTLLKVEYWGLSWKDKDNSPRCERYPKLYITILNTKFAIFFGDDEYWEKWLWIHKYNDGDKVKAKETWPWKTIGGESTW
jgi:hypothetical protein